MKLSTIETLVDEKIITLIKCDKSEKDNKNVVKDKKTGKYYKFEETDEEIKLEILAKCLEYISTIKSIMVGFLTIFIFFAFVMLCSLIGSWSIRYGDM